MTDRNARVKGYGSQLGIFLGLAGGGMVIGTLLLALVWNIMTGRSVFTMEKDMQNPQFYNAIMVAQIISVFFLFFLSTYFFALICYRNPNKFLGFNLRFNYSQLFLLLGILLLTFPLSATLSELTRILPIPKNWEAKFKAMEAAREAQEAALIKIDSFSKYIFSLFVIGFLAGLFEETFFRAGMQNILTRWFKGPWMAIIITSIIFSVIHLSFYGFFVRFALGIILGVIFYYSGSLWLSILFHFLYNGIQVTALYVMNAPDVKHVNELEKNFPFWAGAIVLLIILYLFKNFKQHSIIQRAKYAEEQVPDDDFHNWTVNQSNT